MAYATKDWKDDPDHTTPLSAAMIEDLEIRVTDYAVLKAPLSVMEPPYNAVGDDATDDTTAVQDALTAASGSTLLFPAGYTFRVSDDISVPADTTILGYGATLNIVDNGLAANRSLFVDTVSNVSILGLTVTSTAVARTGVYANIRTEGADHVTIKDCTTGVSPSTGIFLHSTTDFLIENNRVEDPYADGIHIQRGCKRGVVRGNQVRNVADDCIGVISYDDADNCEDIVVEGNVLTESSAQGSGISVVGGTNIDIVSNVISNTNGPGIGVGGAGAGEGFYCPIGVNVVGNAIYNVGLSLAVVTDGIIVAYCRRINVSSNNIDTVRAGHGIHFVGAGKDVNITSNQISRAGNRGINIYQQPSADADMLQRLFTDLDETPPASAGISAVTIANNTIRKSVNQGIYTAVASGDRIQDVRVIGNECAENGIVGTADFFMGNLDYGSVTGNTSRSTGAGGHFHFNTSASLAITGNVGQGAQDGFLFLDADNSACIGNVADISGGSGFWQDGSSTGNIGITAGTIHNVSI